MIRMISENSWKKYNDIISKIKIISTNDELDINKFNEIIENIHAWATTVRFFCYVEKNLRDELYLQLSDSIFKTVKEWAQSLPADDYRKLVQTYDNSDDPASDIDNLMQECTDYSCVIIDIINSGLKGD